MPSLSPPELLLILVIIILLFGVGRIGKVASELGTGIRSFRKALQSSTQWRDASGSPSTAMTSGAFAHIELHWWIFAKALRRSASRTTTNSQGRLSLAEGAARAARKSTSTCSSLTGNSV